MLRSLLLASVLLTAAPAPLDARHAALLGVLSNYLTMGCTPAQLHAVAADATIESLGRVDGEDVILAQLKRGCPCSSLDCPVVALRLTAGKPRIVLWSAGYWYALRADKPLRRIVVRSHDIPPISHEQTFAYRDGRYADVENARVRSDTNERKSDVAVRFAPGASSVKLHGHASHGWYDAYTFGAEKGQQLVVDDVSWRESVALILIGGGRTCDVSVGVPESLRATGTYVLRVWPESQRGVPYAFRLAITRAGANASTAQPVMRWERSTPVLRCVPP
jgi:hypothetical protein